MILNKDVKIQIVSDKTTKNPTNKMMFIGFHKYTKKLD